MHSSITYFLIRILVHLLKDNLMNKKALYEMLYLLALVLCSLQIDLNAT